MQNGTVAVQLKLVDATKMVWPVVAPIAAVRVAAAVAAVNEIVAVAAVVPTEFVLAPTVDDACAGVAVDAVALAGGAKSPLVTEFPVL